MKIVGSRQTPSLKFWHIQCECPRMPIKGLKAISVKWEHPEGSDVVICPRCQDKQSLSRLKEI